MDSHRIEVAFAVFLLAAGTLWLATPAPFITPCYRSHYSRARSDMRSLATTIEIYFVDHGSYPRTVPLA